MSVNFKLIMKVTAQEVAQRCNTSTAAVSRAFRAEAPIAEDLRARILKVARELGYFPPAKRSRSIAGRSKISIVVGDISNPFYSDTLERFSKEISARKQDMELQIVPPGENVDSVMSQVFQRDSDAAIIMSANLSSELARQCNRRGLPVVLFNRVQAEPGTNAVCADNYNGGRLVAKRLVDKGCASIAFIGGVADTSTHLERRRGFLDELKSHGLRPVFERNGQYDYAKTFAIASDLFDSALRPQGIFCANDIMAIAAIDAAKNKGLTVGRDVLIIGFDDVPMASWTSYRLTTVRQRVNVMVRAALNLIDDIRHNPEDQGSIHIVRGDLIERDSG